MNLREMLSRKNLLKAMLIALGLSALSGAAIIVMPGTAYAWRVFVMALLTAASCVALIIVGAGKSKDDGVAKAGIDAGLLGLGLVVLVYSIGIAATWAGLLFRGMDENLALLALVTLLCALPALIMVKWVAEKSDWLALGVGGVSSLAAWLLLGAACFMSWGSLREHVTGSGFATLASGMLAAICLAGVTRQTQLAWRWVGVIAAAGALGMSLYGIWIFRGDEPVWLVAAFVGATVPAYMNVVRRFNLPGWARWIRVVGVVALAASGLTLVVATYGHGEQLYLWESGDLFRVFIGTLIIAMAASLALGVVAMLNRRVVARVAPAGSLTHIDLTCPRCARRQTSPVGTSLCTGCNLRISVQLHLPICPKCEYDLADVRGEKCPECGTPIPDLLSTSRA